MGPRSLDRGNMPTCSTCYARRWDYFNGAAISRSRKYAPTEAVCQEGNILQWGRDLSIAEIYGVFSEMKVKSEISMGPRSLDRGNIVPKVLVEMVGPCFNGAAISRSRKYSPEGRRGTAANRASMGPRSLDRGNIRVLFLAVCQLACSMGPRSLDRGNMPSPLR